MGWNVLGLSQESCPTEEVINELLRDKARLDWLADPENKIAQVLLPREIVERNLGSLRDAIDEAMKGGE